MILLIELLLVLRVCSQWSFAISSSEPGTLGESRGVKTCLLLLRVCAVDCEAVQGNRRLPFVPQELILHCKQKHEGNPWDVTSSWIKAHTKWYGSVTGRTLGKGMVAIHAIGSLGNFNKRWHGKEWHSGQGGMEQPTGWFCWGPGRARGWCSSSQSCLFNRPNQYVYSSPNPVSRNGYGSLIHVPV